MHNVIHPYVPPGHVAALNALWQCPSLLLENHGSTPGEPFRKLLCMQPVKLCCTQVINQCNQLVCCSIPDLTTSLSYNCMLDKPQAQSVRTIQGWIWLAVSMALVWGITQTVSAYPRPSGLQQLPAVPQLLETSEA